MQDSADAAVLNADESGGALTLRLQGAWLNSTIAAVEAELRSAAERTVSRVSLDLTGVRQMDTGGAWIVRRAMSSFEARNITVDLDGAGQDVAELIAALPAQLPEPNFEASPRKPLFDRLFEPLGRLVMSFVADFLQAMSIIGAAVRGAQLKLGRGSGLSPAAVFNQLQQMGVNATPIIALMSFLIGAIIAQQGAFQLRYFGAEVFVVDLVGILQLREIGVLLTAIMVAGRSGSAITAEIGSMKMREEIDALQVMGLNPVGVLVFPRLLALTVALPLLTVISNFAALIGAALVANVYSGVTYEVFLARLQGAIDLSTIISGMLKAPFMAIIIGVVASIEGLKVGGSAESLGKHVTASVVKAIFVVILVDGLFAMFYAAIDF
ncbi:phospholipid/cholesterol/gamma-HCH transport system permease protein [Rhizobium sp. SG_E_25_P2]|jgi:phospholipid/cholesterol/gamma-HCH transport system permease protein|uniref:ABC transporter permease n=1 Tax=Rhizobium sp. SG_E_25_P2 TaxID=2879942 RepID=UPI002474793D|nr:ABC transporter permease [Rhizobium sp. SG_E_25_P2]MDH6268023.1 phospholipid/cholesterol/gamma-HCH transport system permease protein [Rhizobium sp. SG_E_25_P2]